MKFTVWSGGQTGVDRAAWDAAIEVGLPQSGWVPKGRLAEDGRIPDRYVCGETESADYAVRTERNLRESNATLILCFGPPSGGTEFTFHLCKRHRRPHLLLDLDRENEENAEEMALQFLRKSKPAVLNVAGPRGSSHADVYPRAKRFLSHLFRKLASE